MRGFVAELSNGKTLAEDSVMAELHEFVQLENLQKERPWVILKKYLKANNLKLINLILKFDHQQIFLPRHAKAYFFSVKVEAFLGGKGEQTLYYGVGASTGLKGQEDIIEITWYDGQNSNLELRKIDEEKAAFIIN